MTCFAGRRISPNQEDNNASPNVKDQLPAQLVNTAEKAIAELKKLGIINEEDSADFEHSMDKALTALEGMHEAGMLEFEDGDAPKDFLETSRRNSSLSYQCWSGPCPH